MSFSRIHFFVLCLVLVTTCSEWDLERIGFTRVITIGAIEVGSNSAFLIGDIEDIRTSNITESGFVWSASVSNDLDLRFDNVDIMGVKSPGMDTISEDRAFAARATGLNGSTLYYFRAYVRIEGEENVVYGNIDEFMTTQLSLSLHSVHRASEGCPTNAIVTLQTIGLVPGSSEEVGILYSNDLNNLAPTVENGTLILGENVSPTGLIEISIPVACGESYFFRVVLNPQSSDPLYRDRYAFTLTEGGLWENRETFPGQLRLSKPVSFQIDNIGYMIGGNSAVQRNVSDFWEYSQLTDSWAFIDQVDSMNISRTVYAIEDNRVVISTGFAALQHCGLTGNITDSGGTPTSETYEFKCRECHSKDCAFCGPVPDPDVGLFLRFSCICYHRGNTIYDLENKQFEYSESNILGFQIDLLSLEINGDYYFTLGQSPFLTSALHSCFDFKRNCSTSVIKFDSSNPEEMDDFPSADRFDAIGFTIDDLGYVGLGTACVDNLIEGEYGADPAPLVFSFEDLTLFNDLYEINPKRSPGTQWKKVASFPVDPLREKALFGFSLSNKGFVLLRNGNSIFTLWQFTPESGQLGSWKEVGIIPDIHRSDPIHLFSMGNIAYFYFLERIDNFWMYVPEL